MNPTKLHPIQLSSNDFNTSVFLITETHFKNGDQVKKNDLLAVAETSKKSIDIISDTEGFFYSDFNAGDEVKIDQIFAIISTEKLSAVQVKEMFTVKAQPGHHVSLKAQKYLKKFHVSADDALGVDGEVKLKDVLEILKEKKGIVITDYAKEIEKSEDVMSSTQFNSFVSVDFSEQYLQISLAENSKKLKKEVGVDSYFCHCLHKVIGKYPKFSSYLDGNELVGLTHFPVGLYISDGVKAGETFVIPGESLEKLSEAVDQVYSVYKTYISGGSLGENLHSGIFISNLRSMNVSHFIPLLKKNTTATLAVSSAGANGKYNVGVTFDHRLIDGYYASLFLNDLKKEIEHGEK